MATCRDCLGFEFCLDRLGTTKYYDNVIAANNVEKLCNRFKDRSKFIELPCKVGETVWGISLTGKLYEYTVNGIHQFEDEHFMFGAYRISEDRRKINPTWQDSDIGKTVFLTKEEAEQALKNKIN